MLIFHSELKNRNDLNYQNNYDFYLPEVKATFYNNFQMRTSISPSWHSDFITISKRSKGLLANREDADSRT